jgi:hypothetical protein
MDELSVGWSVRNVLLLGKSRGGKSGGSLESGRLCVCPLEAEWFSGIC